MLIESGRIEARTPSRRFEAGAEDLICFPAAEYTEYTTRGHTLFYQTHIAFAPPPRHRLTPWLKEIGPLPLVVPLGKSFEAARRIFETLCVELGQEGSAHQLRVRAAVSELLAIIVDVSRSKRPNLRHLDDWQRARLRLDSDLAKPMSVGELASQMSISDEHFIREFKQRFGVSPKAYHTHARMREAALFLRNTDMRVKAIAYELGFSDPKSFMRIFKKHLGLSPSKLRSATHMHLENVAKQGKALFPVNKHVIPPNAKPNWVSKFRERSANS